jgi:hypothetical protein
MLPELLKVCPPCKGTGFLPNPALPDTLLRQRSDWSFSTWYTAWEEACIPYGGAVITCELCCGRGKYLTAEGKQIVELTQFLKF